MSLSTIWKFTNGSAILITTGKPANTIKSDLMELVTAIKFWEAQNQLFLTQQIKRFSNKPLMVFSKRTNSPTPLPLSHASMTPLLKRLLLLWARFWIRLLKVQYLTSFNLSN